MKIGEIGVEASIEQNSVLLTFENITAMLKPESAIEIGSALIRAGVELQTGLNWETPRNPA
jgi:hypothetical protein